jgi:hypothetical protein
MMDGGKHMKKLTVLMRKLSGSHLDSHLSPQGESLRPSGFLFVFLCVFMLLSAVCNAVFAFQANTDFAPNTALHYLKEAIVQRIPYGYYLEDEDYETQDVEYLKHEDDVYLLGASTEQVRGGIVYCFEFSAFRLFSGRAIVFADGTVLFDFDDSYEDHRHLFPHAEAAPGTSKERDFLFELTGGMWHASPVLGSGWSGRLGFLDDATFIYAANEMDRETRVRFVTGEWSVSSDGWLTLFCKEALRWDGGEVVPAMASTATETEIINADLVKVKYAPVERIDIRVGDYVYDDSTPRPWKICLQDGGAIWGGDGWWWKYAGDWDLNELRESYESAEAEAIKYEAASEAFVIYLDIDNDGKEEIIEYLKERNILIFKRVNNQILFEVNLYEYGVDSTGTGMGTAVDFYEFVRDSTGKVYLHIYTSSFIGNDDEGKRYTSAMDNYYDLKNYELTAVDTINYTWVWDRIQAESEMTDIHINGQPVDSLDGAKSKYTVIENTYVEIP